MNAYPNRLETNILDSAALEKFQFRRYRLARPLCALFNLHPIISQVIFHGWSDET